MGRLPRHFVALAHIGDERKTLRGHLL